MSLLSRLTVRVGVYCSGRFVVCSRLSTSDKVYSTNHSTKHEERLAEQLLDESLDLRKSLQPLNDRVGGPLEKSSERNTVLPFVFLLGNHSSGKSSFVNYVLKRKVQTAGVAPTDDTFTIIVPGPSDVDRDGPAFVGDPDMGFSGLRQFGPNLIHHTQLKIRCETQVKNFAIVDTPGMIDSPVVRMQEGGISNASERGYDFESVCRWYAERADVILLFFDPDKPGTTGETLSILTNALSGLDHKLHIILNKADQFRKIHDFARAYGSLCWNLSKVIHRKDLPRIYTMCLPSTATQGTTLPISSVNVEEVPSFAQGLADLEATREEVVSEVLNAPKRRLDNEISRVADAAALLHLHTTIMSEVLDMYSKEVFTTRAMIAGIGSVSFVASSCSLVACFASDFATTLAGGVPISLSAPAALGITLLSTLTTIGVVWWTKTDIERKATKFVEDDLIGKGSIFVF